MAVTTHAVMSEVGLAQLRVFDEEGLDPGRIVIGHADSYPDRAYHQAIIERGANLEFDFLGMTFTPVERHGEPRLVRLLLPSWRPAMRSASCSARTSATIARWPLTKATATPIWRTHSCPTCGPWASTRRPSRR